MKRRFCIPAALVLLRPAAAFFAFDVGGEEEDEEEEEENKRGTLDQGGRRHPFQLGTRSWSLLLFLPP